MKKIALSVAALALTAGSALAADLPSRKGPPVLPPPPPPPPMWTGFYVGLNAGATWANSNQQVVAVGPVGVAPNWSPGWITGEQANYIGAFSLAASAGGVNTGNNVGFIGGGQIGYNWQFYNNFVVGLEADIQGIASSNSSRTFATGSAVPGIAGSALGDSFAGIHSVRGSLDYLGTVRGRLGWLFTPTLLVYGTGGLAYGGVTLNYASAVVPSGIWGNTLAPSFGGVNFSNTQVGWTAGGGLEWMFMPNWSAKVEYLYYDLGTVTQNFALASFDPNFPGAFGGNGGALFGGQVRARLNGNIVRAGVNYHFNWGAPAPVVAKY
ncbi:outer membrane beta-barrel protein [Methylocystis sp. IM3]|jgi:outer membrane immunogenic protein|uniref:outer membrane protein n=1 Tax=unclassified Methylocystis TaxID=2625913 RepID=UPI0030FB1E03